jgi:WD40 repeat protein
MTEATPANRWLGRGVGILVVLALAAAALIVANSSTPGPSSASPPPQEASDRALPTVKPVAWREAGPPLDRENGGRIELLGTLVKHEATVNRLDFTPDSARMISVDGVGIGNVWDLTTGSYLYGFGSRDVIAAYFNANASQIVAVSVDQQLYFITASNGELFSTVRANPGAVTAAAISADRRRLATGGEGGDIWLWDLTTRGNLRQIKLDRQTRIVTLAFSPDGQTLVASTADKTLTAWRAQTGQPLAAILDFPTRIDELLFTPDGSLLVAAAQDVAIVVDPVSLTRRFLFNAPNQYADAGVAISPDGKLLALGSSGDTLVVWSLETGKEQVILLEQRQVGSALAFAPNGAFLLNTLLKADEGSFIWSVESFYDADPQVQGKRFNTDTNGVFIGAWTPDSRRVILADGSGGLFVWGVPAP